MPSSILTPTGGSARVVNNHDTDDVESGFRGTAKITFVPCPGVV